MKPLPLYKGARLTAAMLRRAGACAEQVALVRKHWPNGGTLRLPTLRKAARLGLSLDWLTQFLPVSAQADYDRALASAWADYERALAPARADYERALAPALYAALPTKAEWDASTGRDA